MGAKSAHGSTVAPVLPERDRVPRQRHRDYLVVGAGAAGLAFVDALVEHGDARILLIDTRDGPGGHWRDTYPFVRLHQASCFYGVSSRVLSDGRAQTVGPEAGLQHRATGAEVLEYYETELSRLCRTGRVDFVGGAHWNGRRAYVVADGHERAVPDQCRVVDATYRAARIPARTPPPFGVSPGALVVPVNELPRIGTDAPEYVVAGCGKTATDACLWLLTNGVPPDAISWVRPREPWMLNRVQVQPDPATMLAMVATTWEAASAASSPNEFFLRLEDAGVMLRIDPARTPTMAKTPTIAEWEITLLRSIKRVLHGAHLSEVSPGRIRLDDNREIAVHPDTVVVHCAASGHAYPPLVPLWGDMIRLQTIRAGFPCFNAALAAYVEATRRDDAEKNRLCPPSPLPDTLASWARMQVLGARAAASFMAEPDIAAWAHRTALNPARLAPGQADRPEVGAAMERIKRSAPRGLVKLAAYGGLAA